MDERKNLSSERAITGLSLNKSWVLEKLKDNVEAAKKEDDHSAVNRDLELTGKELRIFVERGEIGIRDLRNASAQELVGIIAELNATMRALEPTEEKELAKTRSKFGPN